MKADDCLSNHTFSFPPSWQKIPIGFRCPPLLYTAMHLRVSWPHLWALYTDHPTHQWIKLPWCLLLVKGGHRTQINAVISKEQAYFIFHKEDVRDSLQPWLPLEAISWPRGEWAWRRKYSRGERQKTRVTLMTLLSPSFLRTFCFLWQLKSCFPNFKTVGLFSPFFSICFHIAYISFTLVVVLYVIRQKAVYILTIQEKKTLKLFQDAVFN